MLENKAVEASGAVVAPAVTIGGARVPMSEARASHGEFAVAATAAVVGLADSEAQKAPGAAAAWGPASLGAALGLAARLDGLSPTVTETASGPVRIAHIRLQGAAGPGRQPDDASAAERPPRGRLKPGEARLVLRLSEDRRAVAAAARLLRGGGVEISGRVDLLGRAQRAGALPLSPAALRDALRLVGGGAASERAFDASALRSVRAAPADVAADLVRRAAQLERLVPPAAVARWRDEVARVAGAEAAVAPGRADLTRAAARALFDRIARAGGWGAGRRSGLRQRGPLVPVRTCAQALLWRPSPPLRRLERDIRRLCSELTASRAPLALQILRAETMRDGAETAIRRAALWAEWTRLGLAVRAPR